MFDAPISLVLPCQALCPIPPNTVSDLLKQCVWQCQTCSLTILTLVFRLILHSLSHYQPDCQTITAIRGFWEYFAPEISETTFAGIHATVNRRKLIRRFLTLTLTGTGTLTGTITLPSWYVRTREKTNQFRARLLSRECWRKWFRKSEGQNMPKICVWV